MIGSLPLYDCADNHKFYLASTVKLSANYQHRVLLNAHNFIGMKNCQSMSRTRPRKVKGKLNRVYQGENIGDES